MLAHSGDGQLVGLEGIQAVQVALLIALTVGAGDGGDDLVLVLPVAEDGVIAPGVAEAHAGNVGVVALGVADLVVLSEELIVDQAVLIELVGPLDALFVFLGGVGVAHGAVVVDQIALAVHVGHAEGRQEIHAQTDTGEGDLIVGVAVAVRVLLLEGAQHVFQLVDGGGHFQTQIFQPLHVDDRHVAGHGALGHPGGQGVDVAVCGGGDGLQRGHFFEGLGQVGHILLNQVFQRQEVFHVVDDVGLAEGLEAQHHLGQRAFAAGQHHGLLVVSPVVGGNDLPVDLHIGFLFQIHQEGVGLEGIAHGTPAHRQHVNGDGFIHDGHSLGMEAFGNLRQSGGAGQKHRDGQKQRHQFLH